MYDSIVRVGMVVIGLFLASSLTKTIYVYNYVCTKFETWSQEQYALNGAIRMRLKAKTWKLLYCVLFQFSAT